MRQLVGLWFMVLVSVGQTKRRGADRQWQRFELATTLACITTAWMCRLKDLTAPVSSGRKLKMQPPHKWSLIIVYTVNRSSLAEAHWTWSLVIKSFIVKQNIKTYYKCVFIFSALWKPVVTGIMFSSVHTIHTFCRWTDQNLVVKGQGQCDLIKKIVLGHNSRFHPLIMMKYT